MNFGFNLFSWFIILLSMLSICSAGQGLSFDLNARLNDLSTAFYAITEDGASSNFVSNEDAESGQYPSAGSLLYSELGGKEVVVDKWDAVVNNTRVINLRYEVTSGGNSSGLLTLSWTSIQLRDSEGRYSFTLKDYGTDSGRDTLVASTDMNSQSSYSVSNSDFNRYLKIETKYSYCGDGVLSSWEGCENGSYRGVSCATIGLPGNISCSSSCQIDYSGCNAVCGDSIITSQAPFSEECDGANLNSKTCLTEGYVSGSLSCVSPSLANECKLDFSQCLSSDGSPGPSPGGGSGGGGGEISCQNQCVSGQRRCVEEDSYQVCGDFNKDGCSEWGVVDICLGVNPFCKDGFCFGCLSDSDCKEGVCINGKCEVDCGKSCSDLGLQCGKKLICGQLLDCGSCETKFCNKGICSNIPANALKISSSECSPDYTCSPWSSCEVSFDSKDLLSGISWFVGKKSRLCFDVNKCYSTMKDQEDCLLNIEIISRKNTICGVEYIEVFDKSTNRLLARMRDSRYNLGRAVDIFLLPGQIDCEPEVSSFSLSWFERIMFILDIKRVWRLFI